MKVHVLSAAFLACVLAGPAPTLAQQQDETRQQAQVEAMEGELLKVDTETRTISVKASNGAELRFGYTNETVITSSEDGAQGIATIEGTRVRVFFTRSGDTFTATQVVVEPE